MNAKRKPRWSAVLIVAFFISSITVSAAALGSVGQYLKLYHLTVVEKELERVDENAYVEYIEHGNAEGVV